MSERHWTTELKEENKSLKDTLELMAYEREQLMDAMLTREEFEFVIACIKRTASASPVPAKIKVLMDTINAIWYLM